MNRISVSLAGSLAAALVFSAAPAHAAVTAKDAPNKSDLIKAFPDLKGAGFATLRTISDSKPASTCGETTKVKVTSGTTTTGSPDTVYPLVETSVVEVPTVAKAKAYVSAYKKYVKNCGSFTDASTGATITVSKIAAPRVGDAVVAFNSTSAGTLSNVTTTAVVRDGKRIAYITALDDDTFPSAGVKQLTKVAAQKMK